MEGNVTIITDGSDAITPDYRIVSGDNLRREKVLALRREFLNTNGEDYFVNNPEQTEIYLNVWTMAAAASYPSAGNYKVNNSTGAIEKQIVDGLETPIPVQLELKFDQDSAQNACCNNSNLT